MTYIGNAKTDDGKAICIEYIITSHGCPSNGWDEPGECAEIEIINQWMDDEVGLFVDLTDAEAERINRELVEALDGSEGDDGSYFDDGWDD